MTAVCDRTNFLSTVALIRSFVIIVNSDDMINEEEIIFIYLSHEGN